MKILLSNKAFKYSMASIILIAAIIATFYIKNKLEIQNLPSTDLSSISIEGIHLNENIANIDTSKFKPSLSFDNVTKGNLNYLYYEKFSMVTNQEGTIVQLKTSASEHNLMINRHQIKTFADVHMLLGENYVTRNYDWEQGLVANIYYDKERQILAKFIYPKTKNLDRPYMSISLETY